MGSAEFPWSSRNAWFAQRRSESTELVLSAGSSTRARAEVMHATLWEARARSLLSGASRCGSAWILHRRTRTALAVLIGCWQSGLPAWSRHVIASATSGELMSRTICLHCRFKVAFIMRRSGPSPQAHAVLHRGRSSCCRGSSWHDPHHAACVGPRLGVAAEARENWGCPSPVSIPSALGTDAMGGSCSFTAEGICALVGQGRMQNGCRHRGSQGRRTQTWCGGDVGERACEGSPGQDHCWGAGRSERGCWPPRAAGAHPGQRQDDPAWAVSGSGSEPVIVRRRADLVTPAAVTRGSGPRGTVSAGPYDVRVALTLLLRTLKDVVEE